MTDKNEEKITMIELPEVSLEDKIKFLKEQFGDIQEQGSKILVVSVSEAERITLPMIENAKKNNVVIFAVKDKDINAARLTAKEISDEIKQKQSLLIENKIETMEIKENIELVSFLNEKKTKTYVPKKTGKVNSKGFNNFHRRKGGRS